MRLSSSLFILFTMSLLAACGKDSVPSAGNTAPTNLQVLASVEPGNTGNVSFTATATNATSYDFDFGNGVFQTVASGAVTYKYPSGGTYSVNVIAKNGTATTSKAISVTVTVAQSLVWSDEFNGNGAPDPANWGYDIGAGGWGNAEQQYYTNRPENVVQQGGVLKIIAKREAYQGSPWTSARILTKGKVNMKYGRVEVSAKFPAGVGTWPAIWMLGSNIDQTPWPGCGEIDIAEHLGRDLNKIYGTLHYPGNFGGSANGNTTTIAGATTGFHKYTLQWDATSIKMGVDGVVYHTVANSSSIPFNQNFFFILNMAIGGNFGGPTVDPALNSATFEVDYIRVYNN